LGKKNKSGAFPALPELPVRGTASASALAVASALAGSGRDEAKAWAPLDKPKKKKLSALKKRILLERVSRWEASNPPLDAKAAASASAAAGTGAPPVAAGTSLVPAGLAPQGAAKVADGAAASGADSLCGEGSEAVVRLLGVVCEGDVADDDEHAELLDNLAQLIVPLRFQASLVAVHVPRAAEATTAPKATTAAADMVEAAGAASRELADAAAEAMVVVTLRFGRHVAAARGCAEALAGAEIGGRAARAEWAVVTAATNDGEFATVSRGDGGEKSGLAAAGGPASSGAGVHVGEGRAALVVRRFAEPEAVADADERQELLENLENLARRLPGFLLASLPTKSSRPRAIVHRGDGGGEGGNDDVTRQDGSHRVENDEGEGDEEDEGNEAAALAKATGAEPGDAALGFCSGAAAEAAAATLRLLVVGGAPLQAEVVPWLSARGKGDTSQSSGQSSGQSSSQSSDQSNGQSSGQSSSQSSSQSSGQSSGHSSGQ
jgi:hypothetical protein